MINTSSTGIARHFPLGGIFSFFLFPTSQFNDIICVNCAFSVFVVFVIPVGKGHQQPGALSKVRQQIRDSQSLGWKVTSDFILLLLVLFLFYSVGSSKNQKENKSIIPNY